jgi:predicted AlkP superfamily phosphohydrolase/phosphomutase
MTGKLPGKIGLFGFNDHLSNSYDPGLINSTNIKSRMFWETAGDEGKKVYVLNFPLTYPVRKANSEWYPGL